MDTVISILTALAWAIIALVMHESAHVLAANYLGGKIEKVRIFRLGLRARFHGLEKLAAWERYVIYGAGSIANAIVALWTFTVSRLSYFGIPWLEELAFFNLVLCIFNLLPVLPLDGGRIFHQFLSNRLGILRANRFMIKFGLCFSYIIMGLGFLQMVLYNYNVTLLCAGLYIKQQNRDMKSSLHLEFFPFLIAKTAPARGRLMPRRRVQISYDTTIKASLAHLTMDHFTDFDVKKECITITEVALLEYVFVHGMHGTVGDAFYGDDTFMPKTIERSGSGKL